jgi:platelet-activating factor acetylhydrolase IB subunit alpha
VKVQTQTKPEPNLISTGDDKTIKTWDLKTGRCTRTIGDVHTQFIQCMSWGRQPAAAPTTGAKDDKNKAEPQSARPVNVLATGSWDKVELLLIGFDVS